MSSLPFQLRPIHDRVLIEAIKDPEQGLIIVRNDPHVMDAVNDGTDAHSDYRRRGIKGTVIAVGPGKYGKHHQLQPTSVKPGQRVVFSDWNDWETAPEGFYLIREADIWWLIND